ncbi:hypothetical protein DY000_02043157 [Brassica cretica]|uniref:Uncharacterized protein n=1 Tax=Brassica cretica TaxID=69181 RepID=A0ABQ7BHZ4_BRACR|nr:hypothetical protein DY000_02043157 [Brassica cretica]
MPHGQSASRTAKLVDCRNQTTKREPRAGQRTGTDASWNGRELAASYRVANGAEDQERLGAGADQVDTSWNALQEQETRSGIGLDAIAG